MGTYADMMLDGTCCSSCGDYLGLESSYPVRCSDCEAETLPEVLEDEKKVSC